MSSLFELASGVSGRRKTNWLFSTCAGFLQAHTLGFLNLRDLRIVDDDLYHAKTQRIHLAPDNLQPVTAFAGLHMGFILKRTHHI